MCVLTAAYAKDLCLLPALLAIVLPTTDPLRVAFVAFVMIVGFRLVTGLVSRNKGGA